MKKIILNASKDYNCGYHDGYGDAVERACKWMKEYSYELRNVDLADLIFIFRKEMEV